MKKMLSLALAALMLTLALLSLSSCASRKPLYSVTDGARTYTVYGGSKPSRIEVSENGDVVWKQKVSVKKAVGDRGGSYGFDIQDFNFDGYADIKLAIDADNDQLTERVFLQDPSTGSYNESDAFDGLFTVFADPTHQAIFSFSHQTSYSKDYEEGKGIYISADTTTAHTWENGTLVPYRRVSLTYYSERNIYIYSVSDYNPTDGSFYDSDDDIIYPDEHAKTDFRFLYYFR